MQKVYIYIYISVYQNRHSWLSQLKLNPDSPVVKKSISINNESDNKSSKSEQSIFSNSEKSLKCFNFEISYRKFVKMSPNKVTYGSNKHKKKYTVLKPGVWTSIINDEFLKNYKMPCNYVYRRCCIANRMILLVPSIFLRSMQNVRIVEYFYMGGLIISPKKDSH